jgi:hypothetical protein
MPLDPIKNHGFTDSYLKRLTKFELGIILVNWEAALEHANIMSSKAKTQIDKTRFEAITKKERCNSQSNKGSTGK